MLQISFIDFTQYWIDSEDVWMDTFYVLKFECRHRCINVAWYERWFWVFLLWLSSIDLSISKHSITHTLTLLTSAIIDAQRRHTCRTCNTFDAEQKLKESPINKIETHFNLSTESCKCNHVLEINRTNVVLREFICHIWSKHTIELYTP